MSELTKPKNISDKEWEVLKLWNPYGDCMSFRDIAKQLFISIGAVQTHLLTFAKNYPDVYLKLIQCRKEVIKLKTGDKVKNAWHYGSTYDLEDMLNDDFIIIKEKF